MRRAPNGFTLIEVVIAVMILAFLSLFTMQAIQNALKSKTKVQKDIDKNSTLRDALRVMERDINMAFNYRDISIKIYNLAQEERKAAAGAKKTDQPADDKKSDSPPAQTKPPETSTDPNQFKTKEEYIWTKFIGEPEALSFTSLSNIRMMEDSQISSQAEIGYRLKSCRRRSTQGQSSKCLWRRVSNYIHEDITKEGEETVLLENVTEFKLRYLGPGSEEEWLDTWITDEKGDDRTRNKFPYAVEITLEIKDTSSEAKDKPLRMTIVAAIRNPNNPAKEEKKDGTTDPAAAPKTP